MVMVKMAAVKQMMGVAGIATIAIAVAVAVTVAVTVVVVVVLMI